METRVRIRNLPLGSIIDRYLSRAFLWIFFSSLLIAASLYSIVDFFDRIGVFLDHAASVWAVIRYFAFSAPLLLSRVIGFATLFSALLSLSMATRTNEITAMQTGGISVRRIALPLLTLSLFICLAAFLWNETLVPMFSRQAQTIYRREIKNAQQQSLFGTTDIWIREKGGFINIQNFDPRTNLLDHITVFSLDRDFSLRAVAEIPRARWDGHRWAVEPSAQSTIWADGMVVSRDTSTTLDLSETPEDLKLLARDPDEYSFFDLRKQIAEMKAKAVDTTSTEVDLQMKLALPFISPLMVLLAIPFALRTRMRAGVALSFGIAMLIGFGYWVLTAFCISLGHSGALSAWLAAWLPNFIFAMIGVLSLTTEE